MTARNSDPAAAARRKILRQATLYVYGFLAAAVVIAFAGAALLAWLLSRRGLPFLETWLITAAIILLPGVAAAVWRRLRGR